jgi:hypothetical protein
METLKEYKETIDVWGKERKVTITIKAEPDPDAIDIIKSCDGFDIPDAISDYENGNLSVDIIWVEVKCDLFSGTDCMVELHSKYDHLSIVNDHNMVNEAIDDYKTNAKRYKDFFEA